MAAPPDTPSHAPAAPAPRPRGIDPETRLEARLAMVQGISDYNAGLYEKAAANFQRYVTLFPRDAQGRDYLKKAQRALSDEAGGGVDQAASPAPEPGRRVLAADQPAQKPSPGVTDDTQRRREARLALVQGVSDFNDGLYEKAADNFLLFLRVFPGDAQGRDYLQKARRMMTEKKVGAIMVLSRPDGRVFVDGEDRGQTPALLKKVPAGLRTIEVRALGGSRSRQVQVRGGSVLEVQFQLFGGMLIVKSSPSASVSFDGKDMGLTPVQLENMPLGEHSLTLSHKDYHPKTRTVTIRGDYPLTLNLKLRPLKPTASRPAY